MARGARSEKLEAQLREWDTVLAAARAKRRKSESHPVPPIGEFIEGHHDAVPGATPEEPMDGDTAEDEGPEDHPDPAKAA